MKKRGEYYITQFFYLEFANSNIYRKKDETIKILGGCLDIVDGHFVYFVFEFG